MEHFLSPASFGTMKRPNEWDDQNWSQKRWKSHGWSWGWSWWPWGSWDWTPCDWHEAYEGYEEEEVLEEEPSPAEEDPDALLDAMWQRHDVPMPSTEEASGSGLTAQTGTEAAAAVPTANTSAETGAGTTETSTPVAVAAPAEIGPAAAPVAVAAPAETSPAAAPVAVAAPTETSPAAAADAPVSIVDAPAEPERPDPSEEAVDTAVAGDQVDTAAGDDLDDHAKAVDDGTELLPDWQLHMVDLLMRPTSSWTAACQYYFRVNIC